MTRSDNHYAEHIFEILKLKDIDIIEFWKNKGINIDSLVMYDGSGLSCADRLSTKFLTEVLVYMDKTNKGFANLLPIAGKEGTVAKFLVETLTIRKCKNKKWKYEWSSILCWIFR